MSEITAPVEFWQGKKWRGVCLPNGTESRDKLAWESARAALETRLESEGLAPSDFYFRRVEAWDPVNYRPVLRLDCCLKQLVVPYERPVPNPEMDA